MRPLAIFTLLTALTPSATAQRSFSAHAAPTHAAIPRFNSPTGNFAFGHSAHPSGFRRFSPHTSLPFPFFADFFNPDDLYSTGYPVASQPPVILLQAARALAGSSDYLTQPNHNRESATSTQPLMIELQNGHYVRVSSTPANGEPLSPASDKKPAPATAATTLPPALLVFRDGHTEEVRDYTIADGILYARGDYYTDGYWNKKIALSTLNVTPNSGSQRHPQSKIHPPNLPQRSNHPPLPALKSFTLRTSVPSVVKGFKTAAFQLMSRDTRSSLVNKSSRVVALRSVPIIARNVLQYPSIKTH